MFLMQASVSYGHKNGTLPAERDCSRTSEEKMIHEGVLPEPWITKYLEHGKVTAYVYLISFASGHIWDVLFITLISQKTQKSIKGSL